MLKPLVIMSNEGGDYSSIHEVVGAEIAKFKELGEGTFSAFKRNIKLQLNYKSDGTWTLELVSPRV